MFIWIMIITSTLIIIPCSFVGIKSYMVNSKQILIHTFLFHAIQLITAVYGTFILLKSNYLLEMMVAMFITAILWNYFGIKFESILDNLHEKEMIAIIAILLIIPFFAMSFIRNVFDTYVIGMMIFGISNTMIVVWEIIFISMINTINFFQKN